MDVKDKIAKLLALASSPNENEAKVALLKARELMVEHKLRPADVVRVENTRVIRRLVGITCTKMTDTWAVTLSAVIARHHCCIAYRTRPFGAKKVEVGFVGLDDDFNVCRQAFLYAYEFIMERNKRAAAQLRRNGYSAAHTRESCNAYGFGFCRGLHDAYDEQTQERQQEWGLVPVVPQQVRDATSKMSKPSSYGEENQSDHLREQRRAGYNDGRRFNPDNRLDEGAAREALV